MGLHERGVLPGLRSIVALRPNVIGDFMFSLPALHALRSTYPDAHIVLLGKQWHADFLRDRPSPVSEVVVMPPIPGVGAPPGAQVDEALVERLVNDIRARHFDLAIQMYGGGRYSNAFTNQLGAGLTIGAHTPGAAPLDRSIPYGDYANRRLELLQVVALVGAQPRVMARELAVTAMDRILAADVMPPLAGERIVVLHPGASDPRRRWPPASFAKVADALAARGALVAISGTSDEAAITRAVVDNMRHTGRVIDLSGRLSLPALCGLLERACMMLSNDTGPLHLALAIGTPSVGIFWLTNVLEACPLSQHLLRPALSVRVHCPVCGAENRKSRCAHDACFVDDVDAEEVAQTALELYARTA